MGSREGGNLKRVFYCIERNEEISMKKTLVTCLAVVALFAIASSAVAVTCTVDKRPELVLDFNIALTGFDVQSMRMTGILSGKLPSTGDFDTKGNLIDAC